MLERQSGQHDRLGRVGKLKRIAMAATLLAGGASLVPANVNVNISPSDAEGTTICPQPWFTDSPLRVGDNQTITHIKNAIITGDEDWKKKGIFHDEDPLSAEMIRLKFPEYQDVNGIDIKFPGNLRKIVSCATPSQIKYVDDLTLNQTSADKAPEFNVRVYTETTP